MSFRVNYESRKGPGWYGQIEKEEKAWALYQELTQLDDTISVTVLELKDQHWSMKRLWINPQIVALDGKQVWYGKSAF